MDDSASKSPSILIADDDPFVCQLIRLHLEKAGYDDITVVHGGKDAARFATSNHPDLLFLDITMPEMDGLEVLSVVKSTSPETRVIMLTGQAKAQFVTKSIAAGATGYLVKRVDELKTLNETVSLVLEGDAMIVDQRLLKEAAKSLAKMQTKPKVQQKGFHLKEKLTEQELNVLKLIAGGLTNHEISEALSISYNTVKSHVSSIYQKINVSDRTQAAVMALRQGIASEEERQENG